MRRVINHQQIWWLEEGPCEGSRQGVEVESNLQEDIECPLSK